MRFLWFSAESLLFRPNHCFLMLLIFFNFFLIFFYCSNFLLINLKGVLEVPPSDLPLNEINLQIKEEESLHTIKLTSLHNQMSFGGLYKPNQKKTTYSNLSNKFDWLDNLCRRKVQCNMEQKTLFQTCSLCLNRSKICPRRNFVDDCVKKYSAGSVRPCS